MRFGPFEITHPIGEGGMAVVWSGVHVETGHPIAVKFSRSHFDRAKSLVRFFDEVRALARMNHRRIVQVFDAGIVTEEFASLIDGVEEGTPYLVTEAVGFGTLKERGFSNWTETRSVLTQVLEALAHAHARDVIHRDIKPENVLIEKDGGVQLADFGISRLTESGTTAEKMTGTPSYMAPEQVTAEREREGPWTDLYALGCLAYWMTCGRPPYVGSVSEVLVAHVDAPLPELENMFPVPVSFQAWINRLLSKNPQARFQRAADALIALDLIPDIEGEDHKTELSDSEMEPTIQVGRIERKVSVDSVFVAETPTPPTNWRSNQSEGLRLLSTGVGMLPFRTPQFQGRPNERDQIWELFCEIWHGGGDKIVGVSGVPHVGRTEFWKWFGRRAHELGCVYTFLFGTHPFHSMRLHLRRWWARVGELKGATAFYASRGGIDELVEWDLRQLELNATADLSDGITTAVYARWTAALALDRVVLMFSESSDSLHLFERIHRSVPSRRMAVVELDPGADVDAQINIHPMSAAEIESLVTRVVGFGAPTAKQIAKIVDGLPGVAVEIVREAARTQHVKTLQSGLGIDSEDLEKISQKIIAATPIYVLESKAERLIRVLAYLDVQFETDEIEAFCDEFEVDPERFIVTVTEQGLFSVHDDILFFRNPSVRRFFREGFQLRKSDHESIVQVYESIADKPKRLASRTLHDFLAGKMPLEDALQNARALRTQTTGPVAFELLSDLERVTTDAELDSVRYELLEFHLWRQSYSDASRLLQLLPPTPDLQAIDLFLMTRRLEEVGTRLDDLNTENLGETAARMLAYVLMDFGELERATRLLDQITAPTDHAGWLFALARLAYLSGDWKLAEEHGLEASLLAEKNGRLEGTVAALDLVASAMLRQNRGADAIPLYRKNLATAHRLAVPSFVQSYNLATALIETDHVTEEVEDLLTNTVSDAVLRGRRDLEHVARCAQVFVAVAMGSPETAKTLLDKIGSIELGPWVQADASAHLERARKIAPPGLETPLESAFEDIENALNSSTAQ